MSSIKALSLPALILSLSLAGCAGAQNTAASPAAHSQEDAMMVIRVVMKVKPDQAAAFEAYLAEEAVAVRAFDGCERYELFKATASDSYLLYEEWASASAFAAFQKSDTLKKSFAVLGPMLAGAPDSAYYAGAKTGP